MITYTADQLFALREVALSTEWPTYLDEAFKNNRGQWDPDRWHQNKKRGSTPPPEEKAGTAAKDDPSAIGSKVRIAFAFSQRLGLLQNLTLGGAMNMKMFFSLNI